MNEVLHATLTSHLSAILALKCEPANFISLFTCGTELMIHEGLLANAKDISTFDRHKTQPLEPMDLV